MLHPPFFSSLETERNRLSQITNNLISDAVAQTPNGRGWGYQGTTHPLVRGLDMHPMWKPLSEADNGRAPLVFGFLLGTTPVMAERLIPNIEEVTNLPELHAHVFPDNSKIAPLRMPIQHAVAAFALSHWLTVVVLSGSTAELLSVLLYQLALPKVRHRFATLSQEQKGLVTSTKQFADLGQKDRIDLLDKLEIVDASISGELSTIRQTRNLYVHPSRGIKYAASKQKRDATEVLQKTCKLVQDCLIVGSGIHGMDLWNPLIFEHLREKNLISITTILNPPVERHTTTT